MKTRKQIRLKNYDYSSSGWYYVTICAQNRKCLFGKIINGKMVLNDVGQIIDNIWKSLPKRFQNVILNIYQIMPNHLHGIIRIVGAGKYIVKKIFQRTGIVHNAPTFTQYPY